MPRLVISTVGTSLLTNQIDRDIDPDSWSKCLQQTANYTVDEIKKYHEDISHIIEKLKNRAEEKLYNDDTELEEIRELSAELNGIYGLYNNKLEQGTEDTHLLVATDTAQARVTANIVESFLKSNGLNNTSTCIQPGLSIASSATFIEGMAKLIPTLQEIIIASKSSKYQIYFNLVGGFKALQGYFNTIGMFYANEIVYVFEGSNEVIKIPQLPVKVDRSKVEPYKVQLAMMDVGEIPTSWEEAKKVPEEWVLVDGKEMTLSTWGKLIWNQCKDELLSEDLVKFPKLDYEQSFCKDYQNTLDIQERIQLQERLARAAYLLFKHGDGISALKDDDILRLRRYQNTNIDHINITAQTRRVSCKVADGGRLSLRYYGTHEYIYKREGIKK
ncbi:putative CRISPR-associated protein [Aerosakkonema sp. BLCC-F183]|uniref:putative CRISPR-associated protein n=1 Tax=Aerosakkonema sp. BLCC-F183 TaxID=3342834 RepID=UPI0035BA95BA